MSFTLDLIVFILSMAFYYEIVSFIAGFRGSSQRVYDLLNLLSFALLIGTITFLILTGINIKWWAPFVYLTLGYLVGAKGLWALFKAATPQLLFTLASCILAPLSLTLAYILLLK